MHNRAFEIDGTRVMGMIDTGAQVSIIDRNLVQRLGLVIHPIEGKLRSFDDRLPAMDRMGFIGMLVLPIAEVQG